MARVTAKLILRADKLRADGTAPVYLRVTSHRKSRQRATGHYLAPKHWDAARQLVRKAHPTAPALNAKLERIRLDACEAALESRSAHEAIECLDESGESFTAYLDEYVARLDGAGRFWERMSLAVTRAMGLVQRRGTTAYGSPCRIEKERARPRYLGTGLAGSYVAITCKGARSHRFRRAHLIPVRMGAYAAAASEGASSSGAAVLRRRVRSERARDAHRTSVSRPVVVGPFTTCRYTYTRRERRRIKRGRARARLDGAVYEHGDLESWRRPDASVGGGPLCITGAAASHKPPPPTHGRLDRRPEWGGV